MKAEQSFHGSGDVKKSLFIAAVNGSIYRARRATSKTSAPAAQSNGQNNKELGERETWQLLTFENVMRKEILNGSERAPDEAGAITAIIISPSSSRSSSCQEPRTPRDAQKSSNLFGRSVLVLSPRSFGPCLYAAGACNPRHANDGAVCGRRVKMHREIHA